MNPMPTLPQIYLVRHGQTAWSLAGKHTGRTDVPLTPLGEAQAAGLGHRLNHLHAVPLILTSPSQRARRTAELAGFAKHAQIDPDLAEWDYGEFEGLTSAEIHHHDPTWSIFRNGSSAESVEQIGQRADRVIAKLRGEDGQGGDALLFSSAHFLRVLAARWLNLPPSCGRFLALDTTSLSILSYEHDLSDPVLKMWNQCPACD
jgi:probable phosphoglycerate mutase